MGFFESNLGDFRRFSGGIEAFRNSEYYGERMASVFHSTKFKLESAEKKGGKKKVKSKGISKKESGGNSSGGKNTRRKREEGQDFINDREVDEIKKLKVKMQAEGSGGSGV